ncbi:DUF350 domain-containing protein [Oxynema aestuarii]|jgi:uncharacterized membrane protein YjfL (UPF0719 family)|uniref:DUF350 domain-containing protein n=1 Tax=Oxynema aestuarii AP17 TaxID=2064643 RepID=A0A6H1TU92_9CYAN|nr:DUF350 domain-containing protein [Oxynema aestuarii]QIZ70121.1 DUF350 domain-containing protein [Oxynema aestuarii AP17]RMH72696.1 MAG: DUF350 domain-containing protein [Cyanobacteria bacterium J007]
MNWAVVVETIVWSFLGIILLYLGVRLFDKLDPIDYRAEVEKGNLAAGVIVASIILSLAAIVISVIVT